MPSQAHGKWSSEMRTGDLSFIPFVQLVIVHVGQAQAQARVFWKGIPFQCIASNLRCIYRSFRSSILWSLSSHQTSKTTSNQTIKPSYDIRPTPGKTLNTASQIPTLFSNTTWAPADDNLTLDFWNRALSMLSSSDTQDTQIYFQSYIMPISDTKPTP